MFSNRIKNQKEVTIMLRRTVFVLFIALLTFALMLMFVTPASAIINGWEDDGFYPLVGTILTDMDWTPFVTVSGGTGVLISPRVVLLAAHVGYHIPEFWPAVGWGFTVDPNPGWITNEALYGPGGERRIDGTIVRPPGYILWEERDYALMILVEPVPWVNHFAKLPKEGFLDDIIYNDPETPLTFVGYGMAGEEALTEEELAELPDPNVDPDGWFWYLQSHTQARSVSVHKLMSSRTQTILFTRFFGTRPGGYGLWVKREKWVA
jgi:hypothetical protein